MNGLPKTALASVVILLGYALPVSRASEVLESISRHCVPCHNAKKASGDIRLDGLNDKTTLLKSRATLENAWKRVLNREMPPDSARQPSEREREELATWLEVAIKQIDEATPSQAGRVTMRRLNRREYRNTVRDLLGVTFDLQFDPTGDFPEDGGGSGFDTVGDTLTISPLLMERYLAAAEAILDRVVVVDGLDQPRLWKFTADEIRLSRATPFAKVKGQVPSSWSVEVPVRQSGVYSVKATIRSDAANKKQAQMSLQGADIQQWTYTRDTKPSVVERKIRLSKDASQLAVVYQHEQGSKPFVEADAGNGNLFVEAIEVTGPLDITPEKLPEGHRRIFVTRPAAGESRHAAARTVIEAFLPKAFRRPVAEAEVGRYLKLFAKVDDKEISFEQAMVPVLRAIMISPHFLFRVETDRSAADRGAYSLNDFELATRLSYFLWSSMPDDELFAAAKAGKLSEPAELTRQAARLLGDPRSAAFSESFVSQWLHIETLDTFMPSKKFPEFGTGLRSAMQREPVMLFQEILARDRSLIDLLDADFTYLNEPLARHYGIPLLPREPASKNGDAMRRYPLDDKRRGGVLTMGAVLAVTSHPDRTSPTKRGKFVLEALLGQAPPPPPPMVEPLEEQNDAAKLTLRQRLEQHRTSVNCAGCHKRMDPLGFAFENFDVVGRWREKDGNLPIDASAVLPDGRKFSGVVELRGILLAQKDDFIRCLTEKIMTYALGRPIEPYDRPTVKAIVAQVRAQDFRSSALIAEIVTSYPFRSRSLAVKASR